MIYTKISIDKNNWKYYLQEDIHHEIATNESWSGGLNAFRDRVESLVEAVAHVELCWHYSFQDSLILILIPKQLPQLEIKRVSYFGYFNGHVFQTWEQVRIIEDNTQDFGVLVGWHIHSVFEVQVEHQILVVLMGTVPGELEIFGVRVGPC